MLLKLLDHPVISARYFFPRRSPVPDAGRWEVDVGDAVLHCWRHEAGAPRCFVHFHGNGEVVNDYRTDYAVAMVAMGLDVVLVEYRGYGGSTGVPQMGSMLSDVSAVIDALGRPASELVIYGRSVGSIYAIEAARRYPDIAALVLESGVAAPHQRLAMRMRASELNATEEQLREAADKYLDHRTKLAAYTGPLLVMHAKDDEIIPIEHAVLNHAWGGGDRKKLVLFDRGGHNAILHTNWQGILDELRDFVVR